MKKQAPDSRVLITPTFRAAWMDMVANHPRVPSSAVHVACIVCGHFNNKTGETYVGQERVAEITGLSPRTIWSAISWLVKNGYLTKRRGGRASNTYGMPLENVATYCEIYFGKSRNPLRNIEAEISQPEPEISQKTTLNLATGCERTLYLNSYKNSGGRSRRGSSFAVLSAEIRSRADQDQIGGAAPTWQQRRDAGHAALHQFGQSLGAAASQVGLPTEHHQILAAIRNRLGSDIADSWFTGAEIGSVVNGTGTISVPTKFKRNWIAERFAGAVLECWKSVDPSVTSVEVVHRLSQGGDA